MDRNELAARFAVADYGAKCRAYYAGGPKGPGPDVYSGTAEDAFKMADLFLDYAERIDARPVKSTHTPAPVPPPAPTPAPECPTCESPKRTDHRMVGNINDRYFCRDKWHAPTPAPEAKRPTHVRVTRLAHSDRPATVGKVYEVVRWNYDGSPDVIGDNGSNMSLSKPDGSDEKVWPAWEPAPCPPPVEGSDVTPVAPWINDAANAIMREVKAVADPDDDLDDPEDYAALRGAIEGIIQRAAPPVRP